MQNHVDLEDRGEVLAAVVGRGDEAIAAVSSSSSTSGGNEIARARRVRIHTGSSLEDILASR